MRRAFSEFYAHLDGGLEVSKLRRKLNKDSTLARVLKPAFLHLNQSLKFDLAAFDGADFLVGMDEVGRGPLAGPLVAVCLVLPSPPPLLFLRDSKKLCAAEREFLVPRIEAAASHLGYGVVEPAEFGGETNLHYLTFLAMERAVEQAGISVERSALLIDGKFPLPSWTGRQQAVVKGDDRSFRIAAASILAKVYRDRIMTLAERDFPHYGFGRNVGYGTLEHRRALLDHGPCPLHRRNFVAKILATDSDNSMDSDGLERLSLGESETAAHDSSMPSL